MPMIRIFSYTDHNALDSVRAYSDPDTRKLYDRNIDTYGVKEKLGTNLYVAYQATNRIITVGPRDCYHYILQFVDRDDNITCIFWDVEGRPETENKVRMSLQLGGIKFIPLKNDPKGKCRVELFLRISLGGVIPTWV